MQPSSHLAANDLIFFSSTLKLINETSAVDGSAGPLAACRQLAATLLCSEKPGESGSPGVTFPGRLTRARRLLLDAELLEQAEARGAARDTWQLVTREWRWVSRSAAVRRELLRRATEANLPTEHVAQVLAAIHKELLPALHMKWYLLSATSTKRAHLRHCDYHAVRLSEFKLPDDASPAMRELYAWYRVAYALRTAPMTLEETRPIASLATLLDRHQSAGPLRTALLEEYAHLLEEHVNERRMLWCVDWVQRHIDTVKRIDHDATPSLPLLKVRGFLHAMAGSLQLQAYIVYSEGGMYLQRGRPCPNRECIGALLEDGLCTASGSHVHSRNADEDKLDPSFKDDHRHPLRNALLHFAQAQLCDAGNELASSQLEMIEKLMSALAAETSDTVRDLLENLKKGFELVAALKASPSAKEQLERQRMAQISVAAQRLGLSLSSASQRARAETLCRTIAEILKESAPDPETGVPAKTLIGIEQRAVAAHANLEELPWSKIEAAIKKEPSLHWMTVLPSTPSAPSFEILTQGWRVPQKLPLSRRREAFNLRALTWTFSTQGLLFKAAAALGIALALQGGVSFAGHQLRARNQERTYRAVLASVRDGDREKIITQSAQFLAQLDRDVQDPRVPQVAEFLEQATLDQILELERTGQEARAAQLLAQYEAAIARPPLSLLHWERGATAPSEELP